MAAGRLPKGKSLDSTAIEPTEFYAMIKNIFPALSVDLTKPIKNPLAYLTTRCMLREKAILSFILVSLLSYLLNHLSA